MKKHTHGPSCVIVTGIRECNTVYIVVLCRDSYCIRTEKTYQSYIPVYLYTYTYIYAKVTNHTLEDYACDCSQHELFCLSDCPNLIILLKLANKWTDHTWGHDPSWCCPNADHR